MSKQTEAQRLADAMDKMAGNIRDDTLSRWENPDELMAEAAAELRRLEADMIEAIATEREACALVAERGFKYAQDGYQIADDIRARGEV